MDSKDEDSQFTKRQKLDGEGDSARVDDDRGDIVKAGNDIEVLNIQREVDANQIALLMDQVGSMQEEIESLQMNFTNMNIVQNNLEINHNVLTEVTIKKGKETEIIQNKIVDIEKRSMNRNMCVYNVPELKKERTKVVIADLLRDNHVDVYNDDIDIAHRNGPKKPGSRHERPLIAQFNTRNHLEKALEQVNAEKDYRNFDKDAIRYTRQVPNELRHKTAKLHHIAKVLKTRHPSAKILVKEGNVTINGHKHSPALVPPTIQDTLTADIRTIDTMTNINFYASDIITQKGSSFQAFVSPAPSMQDAYYAY
jgi:hypothetical protein